MLLMVSGGFGLRASTVSQHVPPWLNALQNGEQTIKAKTSWGEADMLSAPTEQLGQCRERRAAHGACYALDRGAKGSTAASRKGHRRRPRTRASSRTKMAARHPPMTLRASMPRHAANGSRALPAIASARSRSPISTRSAAALNRRSW